MGIESNFAIKHILAHNKNNAVRPTVIPTEINTIDTMVMVVVLHPIQIM
jgi:hypothetical protein